MSQITSEYLVEYAKKKEQIPTIYMLSGFGRILSGPVRSHHHSVDHRVYTLKCAHTIRNQTRIRAGIGLACFDCVGLIKGALWETAPGQISYNSAEDNNVRGMFNRCTETGPLSTMPEIPGLLVFTEDLGHVGIYIGRNATGKREYIEATPAFNAWGVTRSNDDIRTWHSWGKHDLVTYPATIKKEVGYYEIVQGDTLTKIATVYGTTWQELYELNRDILPDQNTITTGQIIRVPKQAQEPQIVYVDRIVEKVITVEKYQPIDTTWAIETGTILLKFTPK